MLVSCIVRCWYCLYNCNGLREIALDSYYYYIYTPCMCVYARPRVCMSEFRGWRRNLNVGSRWSHRLFLRYIIIYKRVRLKRSRQNRASVYIRKREKDTKQTKKRPTVNTLETPRTITVLTPTRASPVDNIGPFVKNDLF